MGTKVLLTKSAVLAKLKEHQFTENEKVKRAELIEAIQNATEDNIELIEHTATLQLGYMEMDVTAEGNTTTSSSGSYTTRTINSKVNSSSHIWLVSGDVKVAESSELRNGFTRVKNDFRDVNMNSKFYQQYVYRAGNEYSACLALAREYAKGYFNKLNMYYTSSKVNEYKFVAQSNPYEVSYWEIRFIYTTKKGGTKTLKLGFAYQKDLEEEVSIEIQFPWEKEKHTGKIIAIILGVLGVAAICLLWYFFMM